MGDDRLIAQLIGANAGAFVVLVALLWRLRAARRGRRLEQHFLWRFAPVERAPASISRRITRS